MNLVKRKINVELPQELRYVINNINEEIFLAKDKHIKPSFFITGGYVRDSLLNGVRNDIDIYANHDFLRIIDRLYRNNFWLRDHDNTHGQGYNYYLVSDNSVKVDVIMANNFIDSPESVNLGFDYTINELMIMPDYTFWASPQTWTDYDFKLIRLNKGKTITTNLILRACRFISTCGLRLERETYRYLIEPAYNINNINQFALLKQLQLSQRDNCLEEVFINMSRLNIDTCGINTGRDLLFYLQDLDVSGSLSNGDEEDEGYKDIGEDLE